MHAADAREGPGSRTTHFVVVSQLPGLMYLYLVGRNILPTAQRLRLPPSELLSWQRICWVRR